MIALAALTAAPASASFPWAPGGDPHNPTTFKLPAGANQGPNDLTDKREWMYAATADSANLPTNLLPGELGGVRGASLADNANVDQGWRTTTGRPDVTIAVMDSGIEWNNTDAMNDVRLKLRLNKGELPVPNSGRLEKLDGSKECDEVPSGVYDANDDGVFNVLDYACDTRVERDPDARAARGQPKGNGPANILDPQDILIAFSNGTDQDGNGFVDDIAGWDFLDNDNDPFDDVQYGHGTGESRDSNSEANNGGDLGTCPNCTFVPLRVGDSFVADESHFAQAVLYAVDNDVLVVQEALGTLNHTALARSAVQYAYDHGVAVIASAADEAAQHHNWPSSEPHVIMVNSVTKFDDTFTRIPSSYLQFNGCTNFYSKLSVAIPSVSCSSDATGRGAGMAGLIYSAAINAGLHHSTCRRVDGTPCALSANEVRQLMSTTADDVNFAVVETSCSNALEKPICTDPNLNAGPFALRPVLPFPLTFRYPSRKGFDMFFGYGRVNMNNALDATAAGAIPPEAEITSPDWYTAIDPAGSALAVKGDVASRAGNYTCRLEVAPGSQPNNDTDFAPVSGGWCDGTGRSGKFSGVVGNVELAALKARFPPNAGDFKGRESGTTGQSSNGRPDTEPYGFTLRLRVTSAGRTGEDRRNLYLHRDHDLLSGFPKTIASDGDASPAFADLDSDNRNELIVATGDGRVHAYRRDGSELKGWPVLADALPLHTGARAFKSGAVSANTSRNPFLASPAVGDLNNDGVPEVVDADYQGHIYAWNAAGKRVWTRTTTDAFSGKPRSPFVSVRKGKRNRTQRGFFGSPVLADLDGDGRLDVIAAAMDRHVYAWHGSSGAPVAGWPALVVDRSKVASIDPTTHAVTFNASAGDELDQGSIVDTPAVGDLTGDGKPEVVIGTNEEYDAGSDGGLNAGGVDVSLIAPLADVAGLSTGNSRLYALNRAGNALPGWPVKTALLSTELLPVVGEGMTGSPIIGPANCGGGKPVVGAMPGAGFGYLLKADGSSCLGNQNGKPRVLALTPPAAVNQDTPAFPAVGQPAFAPFGGSVAFVAPAAGLRRALDLAVNEYQQGSQDFLAAWDTSNGSFKLGFPAVVNDLQFLTGPSVADIDGKAGQEIVGGTASMDMQALGTSGGTIGGWPKLTTDWTVSNPLIGSFGVLEDQPGSQKSIVSLTRSGKLLAWGTGAPACSAGSWPRFHHDNANSGDYRRDAVAPGKPTNLAISGGSVGFDAVGDDLLCGKPTRYELLSGPAASTASARTKLKVAAPTIEAAGARMSLPVPAAHGRFLAVRAYDEAGNVGPIGFIDTGAGAGSGSKAKPCLPRRLAVSARRIGPARLGRRLSPLLKRYKVARRKGSTTRLCVKGGGRFLIVSKKGKIALVVSTAKRHRTRGVGPGHRLRHSRLKGAKRIRKGLLLGHRGGRNRVLYGYRRGNVRFVAAVRLSAAKHPRTLARRLKRLGL